MEEIERKFLIDRVESIPFSLSSYTPNHISQGYLAVTDEYELRIRSYKGQYFFTKKSTGSLVRDEHEFAIDRQTYENLRTCVIGTMIEKDRYEIPADGYLIELDAYQESLKGLITAEIEFTSPEQAQAVRLPSWLSCEITEKESYKNRALALQGWNSGS